MRSLTVSATYHTVFVEIYMLFTCLFSLHTVYIVLYIRYLHQTAMHILLSSRFPGIMASLFHYILEYCYNGIGC